MANQPQQPPAEGGQQARQQAAFPPPPPYFRQFRGAAEDGADAEPPLAPPSLPAPDATFQMFGELHTAQPGIPPLAVRQLYALQPDGSIDFRGELRRLNRELLFAFADMLAAITRTPSQSARSVELVGVLARNIAHLLNLLRPYQAASTLEHMLQQELEEQQEAIADLRRRREEASQLISNAAAELAALDTRSGDCGGAMPMEADAVAEDGGG